MSKIETEKTERRKGGGAKVNCELSVVIPTYNRGAMLRFVLDCLSKQTLPRERFEVIVVDDGSTDDTREVVRAAGDQLNVRYHAIEKLGYNGGRPRNAGASIAQGHYLVFLDSDILLGPRALAIHYDHLRKHSMRVVLGYRYESHSPPRMLGNTSRSLIYPDKRDRLFNDTSASNIEQPWRFVITHNLSLRRELFETVGGFDEEFTTWGIEDQEFGYRLMKIGAEFYFDRNAHGIHFPHLRDRISEELSWEKNYRYFIAKHPTIEVELWGSQLYPGDIAYFTKAAQVLRGQFIERFWRIPESRRQRTLIIGALGVPECSGSITRVSICDEDQPDYKLVGRRLPIGDNEFEIGVITDWWRCLPLDILNDVLFELRRVAKRVMITYNPEISPYPGLVWWDSIESLKQIASGVVSIKKLDDYLWELTWPKSRWSETS